MTEWQCRDAQHRMRMQGSTIAPQSCGCPVGARSLQKHDAVQLEALNRNTQSAQSGKLLSRNSHLHFLKESFASISPYLNAS